MMGSVGLLNSAPTRHILVRKARSSHLSVSRQDYRDAMARLGAAVNIVTTDGPAGRHGFTASAVCSVTDDPPTLLVCVNRDNDSYTIMRDNGVLCINTLTPAHEALSPIFAGVMGEAAKPQRFDNGAWTTLTTGSPVLQGATVAFDCHIARVVEVGTHGVFFCEVDAISTDGHPHALIYFGRGYHAVGDGPAGR